MPKLHLFYPANDLALAAFNPGYTPPRAAVTLADDGAALPLWYAGDGDRVLAAVPARWYDDVVGAFGLGADVYGHDIGGLEPAPWGWSPAVRGIYAWLGYPECDLPTDVQLQALRQASHRRTSATLTAALCREGLPVAPPALTVTDITVLGALIDTGRRLIAKQPWSSSGRGIADSAAGATSFERFAANSIVRQGAVMIEPYYPHKRDFAMLFEMGAGGECRYVGLSLFSTDSRFAYTGNLVAEESILFDTLATDLPPSFIRDLQSALCTALSTVYGGIYSGPLGIDLMVLSPDGQPRPLDMADLSCIPQPAPHPLVAVAEVNLRRTMGHVSHALGERVLAPGLTATYSVAHSADAHCPSALSDCRVRGQRLQSGTLHLTPAYHTPGFRFSLTVS